MAHTGKDTAEIELRHKLGESFYDRTEAPEAQFIPYNTVNVKSDAEQISSNQIVARSSQGKELIPYLPTPQLITNQ